MGGAEASCTCIKLGMNHLNEDSKANANPQLLQRGGGALMR